MRSARLLSAALAVVLVVTVSGQRAFAAPAKTALPANRAVPSVAGADVSAAQPSGDASAGADLPAGAKRRVAWPEASVSDHDLSASPGPSTHGPISLSRGASSSRGMRMRLEVLDHAKTAATGHPLAMRVRSLTEPGPVDLTVSYRDFADAYGGDWANRLHLVALPECALTEPGAAGCRQRDLAGRNDRASGTVTATVDVTAAGALVALAAGPSSDGGTYAATPLQSTSSWSAGEQSGDFTWEYPMRVPPSLGGPQPQVGLSYSAQSLDGRTAATNSQPSWVGDGFDYSPGAITRSYKACVDDGVSGVGDLCWGTDNAVLAMPGHSGELIQTSTSPDVWRLVRDDGTRVERLTDTVNGDHDNQYWVVTTIDGTRYYFGYNRLPGRPSNGPETKSVSVVPVYGNNAGEPCNSSSGFAASSCVRAYNWGLDYVVDPHGNTMSYWYNQELNHYAQNFTDTTVGAYVRAASVDHIDYGTRQDASGHDSVFTAKAPARVAFAVTDRCLVAGSTCTASTPSNWPDVAWDLQCDSTTNCVGRYTPAFFTQKKLSTVTTQVLSGSSYANVEQWTLNHVFKDPGDSHPKTLFLSSLGHVGLNGGQTTTAPPITFSGTQLNNRVDKSSTKEPIIRFRVNAITNEAGGVVSVNYSPPECVLGSVMPAAADQNTRRCYPVYWTPYGATAPTFDWFHKYVVNSVTVTDPVGGAPAETFQYAYSTTGPMWHYDSTELVDPRHKSWGQWRGYTRVRVTHGVAGTAQQQSDTVYYQGMDGDKLSSGTTPRAHTIAADPDFGGAAVTDDDWLAGQARESIVYNGTGDAAPVVSKTLTAPWSNGPTVTRTRNGVTTSAYRVGIKQTTGLTALDGSRGWRRTQLTNTFDVEDGLSNPIGLITRVDNANDTSTAADDTCTRYTFATNAALNIRTTVADVETVSVQCAATPDRSKDIISRNRVWYDGATTFGTTVTKGDATRNEVLASWNGGDPQYLAQARTTFDANGRVIQQFDAADHVSQTAYPAGGGPVTSFTITDPKGWQTTCTVDPGYGNTVATVDINGKKTEVAYNGLGMVTGVWLPDRDRATKTANLTFGYTLRNSGGPTATSQSAIRADGNGYNTTWTIYDGQYRVRQTQASAAGGGRIVTDTKYDSLGQTVTSTVGYFNAAAPASTLFVPTGSVPGQTVTSYDGAGRPIRSAFQLNGTDKWSSSTYYGGDHVDVTAIAGSVGTSTWTDAQGRTTKRMLFHGTAPTGASETTAYAYYPDGHLKTVQDPAGNAWSYEYDQLGQTKSAVDPDKGKVAYTYTKLGQVATTTDDNGVTLTYGYDELGRKTSVSAGATPLATWAYDSVVKGRVASSTRYDHGNAYVVAVTGYDERYQPTGQTVTIPAAEQALAGTYTSASTHNADGSVQTMTLPGIGGLPAETLTYGYDALGRLSTLSGLNTYVTGSGYDSLGRLGTRTMSDGGGKTLTQIWNYEDGTNRTVEHGAYDEAGGVVSQDTFYTYDASGNVLSIKDLMGQYGGADDNQCLHYDYAARLDVAWTAKTGNCGTLPTAWSAIGGPAMYWQQFTYDNATGNRTSKVDHGAAGSTTRTYTYPAVGTARPHALSKVSTGTTEDTFGYDGAGNTVKRSLAGRSAQDLKWDEEGRLASVKDATGLSEYVYDADGNRLIARTPSGNTLYLGDQELTMAGGATTAVRTYGPFAVRTTAGGLYWTVNDKQGTNELAFKASDLTKSQRRTTPFGESRDGVTTWITDRDFVGGDADATGLVHLGARDYDRATGRFISVDPVLNLDDPRSTDGYGYSHNNPATMSDPSGLSDGFRPYWMGSLRLSWTYGGYSYYLRADFYFLCRGDGHCDGYWDNRAKYHYRVVTIVQLVVVSRFDNYVPTLTAPIPRWSHSIDPQPLPMPPALKLKTKTPQYTLGRKPNCTGGDCTVTRGYCLTDDPDCLRALHAHDWDGDMCTRTTAAMKACDIGDILDWGSAWLGWLGPLCPFCDATSLAAGGLSTVAYAVAGDSDRATKEMIKTAAGVWIGTKTGKLVEPVFGGDDKVLGPWLSTAVSSAGSDALVGNTPNLFPPPPTLRLPPNY